MVGEKREERLEVRLTVAELAMLKDIADADGLTLSDAVRLLVRRIHAERFPKKPKK
jgi:antitoxin component of RelBE/YafQ-DinJ toxin-antitoxin module